MTKVKLDYIMRHVTDILIMKCSLNKLIVPCKYFGYIFSQVTGISFFDNAPSHKKYPSDGLNVDQFKGHDVTNCQVSKNSAILLNFALAK